LFTCAGKKEDVIIGGNIYGTETIISSNNGHADLLMKVTTDLPVVKDGIYYWNFEADYKYLFKRYLSYKVAGGADSAFSFLDDESSGSFLLKGYICDRFLDDIPGIYVVFTQPYPEQPKIRSHYFAEGAPFDGVTDTTSEKETALFFFDENPPDFSWKPMSTKLKFSKAWNTDQYFGGNNGGFPLSVNLRYVMKFSDTDNFLPIQEHTRIKVMTLAGKSPVSGIKVKVRFPDGQESVIPSDAEGCVALPEMEGEFTVMDVITDSRKGDPEYIKAAISNEF
jgi:hypothetical protein